MTISAAVKRLRKHLGQSRQVFATSLGLSMSGVANYEAGRTPEPIILLLLAETARKAGRPDLAEIFASEFGRQLPAQAAILHARKRGDGAEHEGFLFLTFAGTREWQAVSEFFTDFVRRYRAAGESNEGKSAQAR